MENYFMKDNNFSDNHCLEKWGEDNKLLGMKRGKKTIFLNRMIVFLVLRFPLLLKKTKYLCNSFWSKN